MSKYLSLITPFLLLFTLAGKLEATPVAGKDYHECVLSNVEKACSFEAIETVKTSCAAIHADSATFDALKAPDPVRRPVSVSSGKIIAQHIGYQGDALEVRLLNTNSGPPISRLTIVLIRDDSRSNTNQFVRIWGQKPLGSQGASFTLEEIIQPGEQKTVYLDAQNLDRSYAYNWLILDVMSSPR